MKRIACTALLMIAALVTGCGGGDSPALAQDPLASAPPETGNDAMARQLVGLWSGSLVLTFAEGLCAPVPPQTRQQRVTISFPEAALIRLDADPPLDGVGASWEVRWPGNLTIEPFATSGHGPAYFWKFEVTGDDRAQLKYSHNTGGLGKPCGQEAWQGEMTRSPS